MIAVEAPQHGDILYHRNKYAIAVYNHDHFVFIDFTYIVPSSSSGNLQRKILSKKI